MNLTSMTLRGKLVVAGSALAVTAAGVGVGVAYAAPTATPTPSASPSTSAAPKSGDQAKKKHHKKELAKRVLHGEVTLANKKHTVVDLQRGAVSAVSASSVTVKSTDGFSQAYAIDAKTKIVVISGKTKADRKRTEAKITDLKSGATVAVVATKSGQTRTAKRIVVRAG